MQPEARYRDRGGIQGDGGEEDTGIEYEGQAFTG
jgi:hypothetical protein